MLHRLPLQASDWVPIWQETPSMTLLTAEQNTITISVKSVEPILYSHSRDVLAVKVTVADGAFYVAFQDHISQLENCLTFYVSGRNPKQGRWEIPTWYIEQRSKLKSDGKFDEQ